MNVGLPFLLSSIVNHVPYQSGFCFLDRSIYFKSMNLNGKKNTHRGRKLVLIRKRSAEIADLWGSRNQMGYMAGLMSAKFRLNCS